MILSPAQYAAADVFDLLCASDQGIVPMDHRLLHAIADDPARSIPGLVRYAAEERGVRLDLADDLVNIARHIHRPECLPILLNVLRHTEDLSGDLISALREIGEPAAMPLLELYAELDEYTRPDAAFILARLNVRDPRIFDVLAARLADDITDAAQCLAAYGDPAAIPMIEAALAGCEDRLDQMTADSAIATLRAGHRDEEEPEEPFDLWAMYPEEAEPRFDLLTEEEVAAFLDSPDDDYRLIAVYELADPELPEELWDRVLKMARSDSNLKVRAQCWESLAAAAQRPDIRKAMMGIVENEEAPVLERTGSLIGLAASGTETTRLRRWLVEFYKDTQTRARALDAMAASLDERYAVYFPGHIDDEDEDVRLAAIQGVGHLRIEAAASQLIPHFDSETGREQALGAYALAAPCEPARASLRKLADTLDRLAGGLSSEENELVCTAINVRAAADDLPPVFDEDGQPIIDAPAVSKKIGRNDPCSCGSGKKYKKCCGA